jgi:hypothetical protein
MRHLLACAVTLTLVSSSALAQIGPPPTPIATTSIFGSVKPDGSTITISSGVISSVGGGSGCSVSGTVNQMISNNGSTGCQSSAATLTTGGAIANILTFDFGTTTSSAVGNGFYLNAANSVAVSVGGVGVCAFTSTGMNNCSIGTSTASSGVFTILRATTSFTTTSAHLIDSISTGPAVTAGGSLGTATIASGTGTPAGLITAGTTTTGTFTMTFPAAQTGWSCILQDRTTPGVVITEVAGGSTTSDVFQAYSRTTGLTGSATTGDVISYLCRGY